MRRIYTVGGGYMSSCPFISLTSANQIMDRGLDPGYKYIFFNILFTFKTLKKIINVT